MPNDNRLSDWSATYLLDSAHHVMDYVMRGRRFHKLSLRHLRGEFAFGLLRDAMDPQSAARIEELADLNAEFALRDKDRHETAFPSLVRMSIERTRRDGSAAHSDADV